MKINNFEGELSEISAKKEALMTTDSQIAFEFSSTVLVLVYMVR